MFSKVPTRSGLVLGAGVSILGIACVTAEAHDMPGRTLEANLMVFSFVLALFCFLSSIICILLGHLAKVVECWP